MMQTAAGSSSSALCWPLLDSDGLLLVLARLDVHSLAIVCCVSRQLLHLAADDLLWRPHYDQRQGWHRCGAPLRPAPSCRSLVVESQRRCAMCAHDGKGPVQAWRVSREALLQVREKVEEALQLPAQLPASLALRPAAHVGGGIPPRCHLAVWPTRAHRDDGSAVDGIRTRWWARLPAGPLGVDEMAALVVRRHVPGWLRLDEEGPVARSGQDGRVAFAATTVVEPAEWSRLELWVARLSGGDGTRVPPSGGLSARLQRKMREAHAALADALPSGDYVLLLRAGPDEMAVSRPAAPSEHAADGGGASPALVAGLHSQDPCRLRLAAAVHVPSGACLSLSPDPASPGPGATPREPRFLPW